MKYTLIALFTLLLTACATSVNALSSANTPTYEEEPSFSGEPATPPATTRSEASATGLPSGDDQSISSDDATPPAGAPAATTRVTGKVTDGSGNPIPGAGVAVTKSSISVPEILVLTNEEGRYVWTLPPGEFTLTVHKDGYVEKSKDITLKEGETVELDFQLEKQP
jgi:predicted extracellular nuclease